MVIKLAKPTFRAPGALVLAGADGEKIKFVGIFRRQSKTERETQEKRLRKTFFIARFGDDLPAALPEAEAAEYARRDLANVAPITDDAELLNDLCGWELSDIEGNAVPYTPETRTEIFGAYDGLDSAFLSALFEAQKAQRPEKNSEKPSSTTSD